MAKKQTPPPVVGGTPVSEFTHEVSKVSRTLGRKENVEVVFSGTEAQTNGSTIVVPALPENATITREQADILRGYSDHETMHIRRTDMKSWDKRMKLPKDKQPTPFHNFANAIEDARIERHGTAEYEGTKKHISAVVDKVCERLGGQLDDNPDLGQSKRTAGPVAITLEARRRNGISAQRCEDLLRRMAPEVRELAERANDMIEAMPGDKTGTSETFKLAELLEREIRNSDDDGDGEGDGRGRGSGDGAGGEGGESGAGKGDQNGGSGEGDGAGGGAGGDVLSGDFKIAAEVAANDVRAQIEYESGHKTAPYYVWNPAHDHFLTHDGRGDTKQNTNLARGEKFYEKDVSNMTGQIGVMRRKLERMILAKRNRGWDIAREFGNIDPKRLTQAAMGVPNVYRRREDVPEMDTSVMVLVDLSGSMSSCGKSELAQQVCIAMSQCLESIGAEYSVVGFCNAGTPPAPIGAEDFHSGYYSRYESLVMPIFKDFDDTLRESRKSLGMISRSVQGNNSDPDALRLAWNRLRVRDTKRRIMVVVSDGMPAWYIPEGSDYDYATTNRRAIETLMKQSIRLLTSQGCELAGVGLMSNSVEKFYPLYAVANDMDEFAGKAMDTLAKLLVGERSSVTASVAA